MENNSQNENNCTHDCSSCSSNCAQRKAPEKAKLKPDSTIGKTIAVVSGKGGVGKTMVSCLIASELKKKNYFVSILDADITGPSVPKNFGLKDMCLMAEDGGILPSVTKSGINAVSINLMLEDERAPIIWRGPVIAGTLKQFYTDTHWGYNDFLIIDCPPGTGDVPLTVFQQMNVDGIIVVTTPQDLVSMIVSKAVNMAKMMNIPILGIVENMSYVTCPDCGKKIYMFGESKTEEIAREYNIPLLCKLPLDPVNAKMIDEGNIEELTPNSDFEEVLDALIALPIKEND